MRIVTLFCLMLATVASQAQIFSLDSTVSLTNAFGDYYFADIDGDDDLDLATQVSEFPFGDTPEVKIFVNDGTGTYTEAVNQPITARFFTDLILFGDVDGDDDQDMLLTGVGGLADPVTVLYLNDGTGVFTASTSNNFAADWAQSGLFADVDGDDDLDLVYCGIYDEINRLYLNDGTGTFTEVSSTPFTDIDETRSMVAFDMDGDDDLDILMSGFVRFAANDGGTFLYENDGSGGFTVVANTPFLGMRNGQLDVADVDGDGDLDVVLSGDTTDGFAPASGITTELYFNDGSGTFTASGDPSEFSGIVKFSDVDKDDDMDLLIQGGGLLLLNDGSGTYDEVDPSPFGEAHYNGLGIADVDGDGDEDVVYAVFDTTTSAANMVLYRNNSIITSLTTLETMRELTLYPNPSQSGYINLVFGGEQAVSLTLQVFDLTGKQVFSQETLSVGGMQPMHIDLSTLPAGTYLLQLSDGQQVGRHRLIMK